MHFRKTFRSVIVAIKLAFGTGFIGEKIAPCADLNTSHLVESPALYPLRGFGNLPARTKPFMGTDIKEGFAISLSTSFQYSAPDQPIIKFYISALLWVTKDVLTLEWFQNVA